MRRAALTGQSPLPIPLDSKLELEKPPRLLEFQFKFEIINWHPEVYHPTECYSKLER